MGLTLIFPGKLGVLQWISFIPAIIAIDAIVSDERTTYKSAYFYGVAFFMYLYVMAYHWFWSMYPLDFTGLSEFYALCVILLASLGLPLIAAVAGGFTFVFTLFCKRAKRLSRFRFAPMLAFALSYAVFEWTQTHFFTGVPWGRLAIGQTGNPVILSSVSFFGSYFLTFAIVLINAALAYALIYRSRRAPALALVSFSVILAMGIGGYALSFVGEGESLKAAAIQGNMASQEKWSASSTRITIERYTRLTELAASEGATLVVWPESVFPYSVHSPSARECVESLSKKYGIDIFYGCINRDDSNTYNALAYVSDGNVDLESFYFKRKLVPFGEYVPMRDFVSVVFPMLNDISMLSDDVTPGEDSALFDTKYGKIGALICFDTIYETVSLEAARDGAEIIVIGTNDSWFFDSSGVYMHNAQAQIRACETGRYVIRSANTGISSIIDPRGVILDLEPPLCEGYVTADVSARSVKTLYTHIGNAFIYLAMVLIFIPPFMIVYDKISARIKKSK